jgi:hypothetical protein
MGTPDVSLPAPLLWTGLCKITFSIKFIIRRVNGKENWSIPCIFNLSTRLGSLPSSDRFTLRERTGIYPTVGWMGPGLDGESQLTFRRNISPPTWRSKSKPSKKSAWSRAVMLVSCLAYTWTLRKRYVPPKRRSTFTGLHGVITHITLHRHQYENIKPDIMNGSSIIMQPRSDDCQKRLRKGESWRTGSSRFVFRH